MDSSRNSEVQMHKAVCASCGNECEVPFKPNGEKPVYCRDCYRKRSNGRRDFGNRRNFGRPMEMHKAVCASCGNECEVPFKPNGEKPVYCRDCFRKQKENNNDE